MGAQDLQSSHQMEPRPDISVFETPTDVWVVLAKNLHVLSSADQI